MSNKRCPFFGICGGCKYDFASADYHTQKLSEIKNIPTTGPAVWVPAGLRRRGDFCFAGNQFGLFQKHTKNIVPVRHCPNMTDAINNILPLLAQLPWAGTGSCLITECDNGIDVSITSSVPYVTPEFRAQIMKLPIIRSSWNDRVISQTAQPQVSFGNHSVAYPPNAFLQPTIHGADVLRQMVCEAVGESKRTADLFCGLGNFTFALNADGFDIVGTGVKRDLFTHPLTVGMLNGYDCVVMDPPRAGAMAQCQQLARSNVPRIVYVSCNPGTFNRDMQILHQGGYKLQTLIPVDQFTGSSHWEIFSVFQK